ncbi:type II toxin-antitoxin system VapC family toxin [Candidatus Woesearchaeota archaeon]|nr:type II toxin-antitoxin system VapC family toxin [Candidatus Woesearchaeota archaeon]
MALLDTTYLIDLLRGKKETENIKGKYPELFTTQINMYEVISGLFLKNVTSRDLPRALEFFNQINVLPLNDNALIKSAEIYAYLVKKGEPIDDCDCLIGGIALAHGVTTVVTKNVKHFERINGLKIETY